MNKQIEEKLIGIVLDNIHNDLSHDFGHIYRVYKLATKIAIAENADLDVVIPAALFHDIFVYKGTGITRDEHVDSSNFAEKTLLQISNYPKEKINMVKYAISVCSFTKGIIPDTLDAKVLQDADLLESTGAISIMRTFASAVTMTKLFYNKDDPFCEQRKPDPTKYAVDLFFFRLFLAQGRMHTKTAKNMAIRRTEFLKQFISELRLELDELD